MARIWQAGAESEGWEPFLSGTSLWVIDKTKQRTGNACYKMNKFITSTLTLYKIIAGLGAVVHKFLTFHFMWENHPSSNDLGGIIIWSGGAGANYFEVTKGAEDGALTLNLDSGAYAGSTTNPESTYARIELDIDPDTDTVKLYLNGNLEAQGTTDGDLTDVGYIYIGCKGMSGRAQHYWDDLGVNNDSGAVNNGLIGAQKLYGLPVDADGNSTDWAPVTGPADYEDCDEVPISTTDYIYTSTDNHRETFSLTNMPALGGGESIAAMAYYEVATFATPGIVGRAELIGREGGTDYLLAYGSTLATEDLWVTRLFYDDISPAGNPWTEAIVNALEYGFDRYASGFNNSTLKEATGFCEVAVNEAAPSAGNVLKISTVEWASVKKVSSIAEASISKVSTIEAN